MCRVFRLSPSGFGRAPRKLLEGCTVARKKDALWGLCAFARGFQPRCFPLLTDPVHATQRRLVGADVAHRQAHLIGDLLNQRGLSYLARTGHHLQKSARLSEPLGEDGSLGALEGNLFCAHGIEYFYSIR